MYIRYRLTPRHLKIGMGPVLLSLSYMEPQKYEAMFTAAKNIIEK